MRHGAMAWRVARAMAAMAMAPSFLPIPCNTYVHTAVSIPSVRRAARHHRDRSSHSLRSFSRRAYA